MTTLHSFVRRLAAVAGLLLAGWAGRLHADWTLFLPRTLNNGAYIEVQGTFEEDDNRYGENALRWTDIFVREKLTLFSNGYFYHPRFLLYHAAVTGALSQEHYDTSLVPAREWRPDNGFEYDFNLRLLPEHPYNLEVFARRYEPLFTERFAARDNSISTTQGVDARYRKKPYFLHGRYSDDKLTSGPVSSGVHRLGLNGEYFRQFEDDDHLSVTAAFNPSRFERSTGLHGTSQETLLGNLLAFGRYRLSSNLSSNSIKQEARHSSAFESAQFIWQERFDVELPLRFRGELWYRYQDNENRLSGAIPGQGTQKLTNRSRDLSATISHQLYESLTSSYTFSRNQQSSSGGESSSTSQQLGFSYDKTIPSGSLLLGTSLGRTDLDSGGQTAVVNEAHPGVAVPGFFELGQPNVDPASLALFVRSPVSPFENLELVEGVHYTVQSLVNSLEVQILSLPPQFPLPGSYDFTASYALAGGGFALHSEFRNINASVQLFENRLNPYASITTVSSEVRSGYYPGAIPDSMTTTAGLIFRLGNLRGRGEYRNVDWSTNPYSSWLGELQYVGALSRTTRLYATTSHRRWDYPKGRSDSFGSPTSQTNDVASVDLQQKLFSRSMLLQVGGSYSRTHSIYDSHATALNGSLSWKIGRTDLSLGGSIYEADAEGSGIPTTTRTRRLFYLRLRRDLF